MTHILVGGQTFDRYVPKSEAEFESVVVAHSLEIFGPNCIYIECKKKIGTKRGKRNIPDGYLIDLIDSIPQIWVVEVELKRHDLFGHIGRQLLEFAYSYSQSPDLVRQIVASELENRPSELKKCKSYAATHGYRNVDHLISEMISSTNFQTMVIIDDYRDSAIEDALKPLSFQHPVYEVAMFRNESGEFALQFEPYWSPDDQPEAMPTSAKTEVSELNTIVVPARKDGFERAFLGENRWYAIRIHGSMIDRIEYIAGYQVAPVSAITHIAPVRRIFPWRETGKYCVEFAQPAQPIGPIKRAKSGRGTGIQSARYADITKLRIASTIDEIFG